MDSRKRGKVIYDAGIYIKKAKDGGMTNQQIAELCGVSVVTVSRWSKGNAKESAIKPLMDHLQELSPNSTTESPPETRLYLDEASLEDLARRAKELGFRASFTDISS
jgi:transcriptional regulator with XRE-family HTH domain